MPLIAHSPLPAFERLRDEGHDVAAPGESRVRELHIGLLNMMPDAALQPTERQFMRLLAASSRGVDVHVHPFTVAGLERRGAAAEHVATHYSDFASLRRAGLDALVVTGANPVTSDITREGFWNGMVEVLEWARENVPSTLCSCLATHAVLKVYHGVDRIKLPRKRWGVYSHRVVDRAHPMVGGINTRFDAPHSHVYEVTRAQIEGAGMPVLVESEEAGVHLAVSADGLRFVFFQGHPEYDANSLLKEYKREVQRFHGGEREDYPPYPEHYFVPEAAATLEPYAGRVIAAKDSGEPLPNLPEDELTPLLDNTWTDTGKALFDNWLRLLCGLAGERRDAPDADSDGGLGAATPRSVTS